MQFGSYVKFLRVAANLSQVGLAARLSNRFISFSKLDRKTISRWEAGSSAPSLVKQLMVIRCLDGDILMLSIGTVNNEYRRYLKIYEISERKNIYNKREEDEISYKKYESSELNALDKSKLSFVIRMSYDVDFGIQDFDGFDAQFYVGRRGESICSHFVYYVKKIECLNSPICSQEGIFSDLHILSTYHEEASHKKMTIQILFDLMSRCNEIRYVYLPILDNDLFQLFDLTNCEIIKKGPPINDTSNGVFLYTRRYKFIQIKVQVEYLLAVLIKLMKLTRQNNEAIPVIIEDA
ncbi:helix-turn-helix domain-containing protein [Vibrio vulnificus]|uniref:helix-turn-helix domain-containing protein n=1 Tax=Vibrio vulnificus TaxID=672 RepID=UPI0005F19F4E|nr:helix-turn-helix transcriptional regulator [Vibrio vulnificus]